MTEQFDKNRAQAIQKLAKEVGLPIPNRAFEYIDEMAEQIHHTKLRLNFGKKNFDRALQKKPWEYRIDIGPQSWHDLSWAAALAAMNFSADKAMVELQRLGQKHDRGGT